MWVFVGDRNDVSEWLRKIIAVYGNHYTYIALMARRRGQQLRFRAGDWQV